MDECYKEQSLLSLLRSIGNQDSQRTSSSFENLFMVALIQRGTHSNSKHRPHINPHIIDEAILIQRNKLGQVYTLPDLHASLHFSANLSLATEIIHRIMFIRGSDNPLKVTSIPNDSNYCEGSVFVMNPGATRHSGADFEITQMKESFVHFNKTCMHFTKSCQDGLLDKMVVPIERGANRKSPSINFGFTKTDCGQYPAHRSTIAGNVDPSLSTKDIDHTSSECRNQLLLAIDNAMKACPDRHNTFNISSEYPDRPKFRRILNKFFGVDILQDSTKPVDKNTPYIPFEAGTILCPLIVGGHRDLLNDHLKTMHRVMQVNMPVSIADAFSNNHRICQWLKARDLSNIVPMTLVGYSRKVVAASCEREKRISTFSLQSTPLPCGHNIGPLREILASVLKDVWSHRDYYATTEKSRHTSRSIVVDAITRFNKRQDSFFWLHTKSKDDSDYLSVLFATVCSPSSLKAFQDINTCLMKVSCPAFTQRTTIPPANAAHESPSIAFELVQECINAFEAHNVPCPFDSLKGERNLQTVSKSKVVQLFSTMYPYGLVHYLLGNIDKKTFLQTELTRAMDAALFKSSHITSFWGIQNNQLGPLFPDYDYTFNGPVIRLPASWDKEVSAIHFI